MKKTCLLLTSALLISNAAFAKGVVKSPAKGVLCDQYVCADKSGISNELTKKYLGEKRLKKLIALGDIDRTGFTLANGVYCDTGDKRCYVSRYFIDNKRDKVSEKYTKLLFSKD